MLKIWGRRNSVNVKKVVWAVEEMGLPYELTEAGMSFGLTKEPWFLAMNPNGLVPVIQDGETTLWESNAIVRYLGGQYGSGSLSPAGPAARAQADKWMDWSVTTLYPHFRDIFWNLVRERPENRDMQAVEKGCTRCGELLGMVDAVLARQPFLSGERLGIGDIPLGCYAYGYFELPISRPDLPNLTAWYQGLKARPAYRKAVVIPLT